VIFLFCAQSRTRRGMLLGSLLPGAGSSWCVGRRTFQDGALRTRSVGLSTFYVGARLPASSPRTRHRLDGQRGTFPDRAGHRDRLGDSSCSPVALRRALLVRFGALPSPGRSEPGDERPLAGRAREPSASSSSGSRMVAGASSCPRSDPARHRQALADVPRMASVPNWREPRRNGAHGRAARRGHPD